MILMLFLVRNKLNVKPCPYQMNQPVYVGIDIGTTNTCAYTITQKEVLEQVTDENGKTLIRSVVCFCENGEVIVGNRYASKTSEVVKGNVVFNAKRIIGLKFNDPRIKQAAKSCQAKVVEDANGFASFWIPSQKRRVSPIEIYTRIINYVWSRIGLQFRNVVCVTITCPAMFKNEERTAIMRAIKDSDIRCPVRMINEPCAAAIYYGVNYQDVNGVYAIYDLGGGTFDVSLISVEDGSRLKVLHSGGSPVIGGQRFDDQVIQYLQKLYHEDEDDDLIDEKLQGVNPESYHNVRFKLMEKCREAKEFLLSDDIVEIELSDYMLTIRRLFPPENEDCLSDPDAYNLTIDQLNDLIKNDVSTTIDILKKCIEEKGYSLSDVKRILMVGGSSRLRLVRQKLEDTFTKERITYTANPDTVVAQGAAQYSLHKELRDITIEDSTKWDFATLVRDRYEPLIKKDTVIPCKVEKDYIITRDHEGWFYDQIYEGDIQDPSSMKLLKYFESEVTLQDDPLTVRYTFEVPEDGILYYSVVEVDTGRVLQERTMIRTDWACLFVIIYPSVYHLIE